MFDRVGVNWNNHGYKLSFLGMIKLSNIAMPIFSSFFLVNFFSKSVTYFIMLTLDLEAELLKNQAIDFRLLF